MASERFATAADSVYAVGDVVRGPMLARKASGEGIACVEMLAGGHGHVEYDAIPSVVIMHRVPTSRPFRPSEKRP